MSQIWRTTASLRNIRQSCYSIGDDNPLYTDPKYGRYTRWGTLIAHPTFVAHLRYNMWRGARGLDSYATTSLVAGFGWEWFDVLRIGDEFKTSFYADEVIAKKGRAGPLCFTYSHAKYWNQLKELVARGRASNCIIGKAGSEESIVKGEGVSSELIYERGVYHYSEDEIKNIVDGIEGETRKGCYAPILGGR